MKEFALTQDFALLCKESGGANRRLPYAPSLFTDTEAVDDVVCQILLAPILLGVRLFAPLDLIGQMPSAKCQMLV